MVKTFASDTRNNTRNYIQAQRNRRPTRPNEAASISVMLDGSRVGRAVICRLPVPFRFTIELIPPFSPDGEIGRRSGLKIRRSLPSVGVQVPLRAPETKRVKCKMAASFEAAIFA